MNSVAAAVVAAAASAMKKSKSKPKVTVSVLVAAIVKEIKFPLSNVKKKKPKLANNIPERRAHIFPSDLSSK
jgi:hypothetical protein